MNTNSKLAIFFAGKEILAAAQVEFFSKQERMKKAAQAFGMCWLAGLFCVAVPVLHFVLTPAALLMGPIAAALVYSKVKDLPKSIEGEVECVHCHALTRFSFKEAKPPLFEACSGCKTGYEVLWPPREIT